MSYNLHSSLEAKQNEVNIRTPKLCTEELRRVVYNAVVFRKELLISVFTIKNTLLFRPIPITSNIIS